MLDPRDQVLQSLTPTVMVPRFGAVEPLTQSGHRFLMAGNGLWLEVIRPWLQARVQLQRPTSVAMPYGMVEPMLDLRLPGLPLDLLRQVSDQARRCSPVEAAAWIVWSESSGRFALRELPVLHASAGHVHFERPALAPDEHLVLDLHSHGCGRAYFSSQDNRDDRGEIKISGVIGDCHQEQLSTEFRLCLLGQFIPLSAAPADDGGIKWRPQWNTSSTPDCSPAR